MKHVVRIALAAALATSFAVPAIAGEWVYHGGPKSPDSLTSYEPDYGYYGGGPSAPGYYGSNPSRPPGYGY